MILSFGSSLTMQRLWPNFGDPILEALSGSPLCCKSAIGSCTFMTPTRKYNRLIYPVYPQSSNPSPTSVRSDFGDGFVLPHVHGVLSHFIRCILDNMTETKLEPSSRNRFVRSPIPTFLRPVVKRTCLNRASLWVPLWWNKDVGSMTCTRPVAGRNFRPVHSHGLKPGCSWARAKNARWIWREAWSESLSTVRRAERLVAIIPFHARKRLRDEVETSGTTSSI